MTFRLTAILFLLLLLCCCSHEEAVFTEDSDAALVRLSVTIVTPSGSTSRSVTNPDGKTDGDEENGTEEESNISSALVVLASLPAGATTPTDIQGVYIIDRLSSIGNHQWRGEIVAAPGSYRLLVVANPSSAMTSTLQATVGQPWIKALQASITESDYTSLSQLWAPNQFTMTNAYTGTVSSGDVHLIPNSDNNSVVIPVQRVCARFDYQCSKSDNTYTITTDATVAEANPATLRITLTHAGLMNISRGYHLFKQMCSDDTGANPNPYTYETATNYVLDTDWTQKKTLPKNEISNLFFYASEAQTTPVYVGLPQTESGAYSTLFYASENTLPGISRQINCLSTAVVFQGYFTLEGTDNATNLYYIENKKPLSLYTDLEQLLQDNPSLPTLTTDATDEALAAAGICRYQADKEGRFPVYYTYWNRHNDNQNPIQMGIMEFAVVRNNIYRLRVNSISFLGLPKDPTAPDNPWKPDGDTPDEQEARLDVTVTVAGWIDRTYDFDI